MKTTLIAAALTLSAITTAHADSPVLYGEGNYPRDPAQSQASTLTREAVIADLLAARANGTMPRYGEADDMAAAPSAASTSSRTRAEVRHEAIAATQAAFHARPQSVN